MKPFGILWVLIAQVFLQAITASPLATLERRLAINPTCSRYSELIKDAIRTVQDMCTATLDSAQWILDNYDNDRSDDLRTHQMRIAIPMITLLAIDLEQNGVDEVNRRKLQKLKEVVTGVRRAVTQNDIPVFCHDGFRKKTTESNGQVTYWDTLWKISEPSPTCADQPKYGYMMYKDPMKTNTEERMIMCPERLAQMEHTPSLSQYKVEPGKATPYMRLDTIRDTIAVVLFHESTHSKRAGKLIDATVTDGTRTEMAYGYEMIKYLTATTPARTLRNADTIALFAAAMYLDQFNWGYGFAEPLSEMCG